MAITTIRTTYALDVPTVRALDNLAQHWRISKSETLRRLILSAAKEQLATQHDNPRLAALRALQDGVKASRLAHLHAPPLPSATGPMLVEPVPSPVKNDSHEQLDSWLL
jgi:hypothetical protein